MSRKRMLSPDIWTDEGFLELEPLARLLFIGLISHADDSGRGVASARSLRARIFPGDGLNDSAIDKLKAQIQKHTRCTFYAIADTEYYELDRWHDHQKVSHPYPSSIPGPNGTLSESSENVPTNELVELVELKKLDKAARKRPYASTVSLTDEEHAGLEKKHGADVVALAIELLDAYKQEKGKHYRSDAGALRSWGIQAALERREKTRGKQGASAPRGRKCPKCGEENRHTGSMCLKCGEELQRGKG